MKITSDVNWITFTKDVSERGNNFLAKLVISTKTNETGERTGTITVKSDKYEQKIYVRQNSGLATYFDLSTNSLVMSEEGTEEGYYYSVNVETDGTTWSVSSAPDWLTAEAKIPQGKLHVTLPENTGKIKTARSCFEPDFQKNPTRALSRLPVKRIKKQYLFFSVFPDGYN